MNDFCKKSSDKFAHLGIDRLVCMCITLVIILHIRIWDLWHVVVSSIAGTIAVMMFEREAYANERGMGYLGRRRRYLWTGYLKGGGA